MKKILLLIGISLLVFMACDEAPEEGTPLSEIPIDGDGDINGDDVADVGGGMHLGSGILDEDGKLDGDFSDDGDDEWSGAVNIDADLNNDGIKDIDGDFNNDGIRDLENILNEADLPQWAIGDKRTIKIDKNPTNGNWILDYNDNLTSELDPTRFYNTRTFFFKEAGSITDIPVMSAKNISAIIQMAFTNLNSTFVQLKSGMDPEDNNKFSKKVNYTYGGWHFTLDIPADKLDLTDTAVRVSISLEYAFTAPTTGLPSYILYMWKGKFIPQTGHHEVQLVGYIVNGRTVGDANSYSSYIPI